MSSQALTVCFKPLRRACIACALLCCAICASAQTDNAPQGVITGRVIDESGQPIANAQIYVGSPRGRANASSDTDGRFSTDSLPRSAYTISASAPGYYDPDSLAGERGERTYYQLGDAVTLRLNKGAVITGRVTNANGEPLIAVRVNATRIRPLAGPANSNTLARVVERTTDDRGVYRFYGLLPGVYLVNAGGQSSYNFNLRPSPYDDNAPTFYPSTTRDGATEIALQAGQEAADIDIRYRGDAGHAVSGALINNATQDSSISIMIFPAGVNYIIGSRYVLSRDSEQSFVFTGITDGDYDLVAEQVNRDGRTAAVSQRISVRGTDVTGVKLALAPLAALTGRVVLEAAPADAPWREQCAGRLDSSVSETTLSLRREADARGAALHLAGGRLAEAAPDDKGAFAMRGLAAGRFRLTVRPPNSDWYVRAASFALANNAAPNAPPTASKTGAQPPAPGTHINPLTDGLTLTAGAQVNGLTLTLAPGAAALRGRVVPATEGAALPDLQVYLVPAEREFADEPLRYALARVRSDGAFAFTHLAPGHYHLLARTAPPRETESDQFTALLPDAPTRALLRREAEPTETIELQPCQRRNDYVLRYTPTQTKN